ncbi:pyruvate kinase [Brevibacillus sp. H7]|uniref:pyruvate kinase n=1 Tax=Brevibacillus sp. H7 TaxID=3349138 RepID=UPI0037F6F06E
MSIDIICTIGPASHSVETLKELIQSGMTIARLNMSHGDHLSHKQGIRNIRQAAGETGKKVKILGDVQGPKIRLGEVAGEGVVLTEGDPFILHTKPVVGSQHEASVDYAGIVHDVKPGARVLINDGEVKLLIEQVTKDSLLTRVLVGGMISSHKGVNIPGASICLPALTEKDQNDLRFLLLEKVDMIACSFIRVARHMEEIRRFAGVARGHAPWFIAKIETMDGLRNFSQILDASDGIMIARGDLGVEVPYTWVPLLQKAMIKECRRNDSYCITATQMLQSMTEHPVPTRAEVTDVFQAVLDGTHAVMLSAESASGRYPVQSTETLNTVSSFAERVAGDKPFDLVDIMNLLKSEAEVVQ